MSGGRTHLAQQAQDLEAAVVDLEGRRAGEAVETAPEGRDEVEEDLRHGGQCGGKRSARGSIGSCRRVLLSTGANRRGCCRHHCLAACRRRKLGMCPSVVSDPICNVNVERDSSIATGSNCRRSGPGIARDTRTEETMPGEQIQGVRNAVLTASQQPLFLSGVLTYSWPGIRTAEVTLPRNRRQGRGGSCSRGRMQRSATV